MQVDGRKKIYGFAQLHHLTHIKPCSLYKNVVVNYEEIESQTILCFRVQIWI